MALDAVPEGAGRGTAEKRGAEAEFDTAGHGPRGGEFRLAWLWVEGWRQRLRKSGDVVEKTRRELGMSWQRPGGSDDIPSKLPPELAAASAAKTTTYTGSNRSSRQRAQAKRRSVHFK